jgi:hypothetical protein
VDSETKKNCLRCGAAFPRFGQGKGPRNYCSDMCRFMSKVNKTGGCWLWTAAKAGGYGRFALAGGRLVPAHRYAWEVLVGPIPAGMQMDHLCRTPACVNPAHLEPVTQRENALRGEAPTVRVYRTGYCARGHSMADAYTVPATGANQCRTCNRERARARRAAKKKEAANA